MAKRLTGLIIVLFMVVSIFEGCPPAAAADRKITMSGMAHVQTYGDTEGYVKAYEGIDTLVLGTRGEAKRVERIAINLTNNTGYSGDIEYRVHCQTYGWTPWQKAGAAAGTTGEGKRLEAVQIRLTGELAKHYDVRYAAHAQTYGDNQGWVYNGALAGTTGEAKRLEEIRVQIIPKGEYKSRISYRVHRQTYGWEPTWANDGAVSGTTGEAKRLEGITIDVKGNEYQGGVNYRTHVQTYGWMDYMSDGFMSGTQGEAKRLEAIEISLYGELAEHYDVYYRVHAQRFGWMGWVSNGAPAGTAGYGYRLEAIQIVLVNKGAGAPPAAYNGAGQNSAEGYSDKNNPSYVPPSEEQPEPEKESVWHEPRYFTYTEAVCSGCNGAYRNEHDWKLHLGIYYDDQCDETMTYTLREKKLLLQEGYWEKAEGTYVPAEYEAVWFVTDESYTEKDVPWFRLRGYLICMGCGEKFYDDEDSEVERLNEHVRKCGYNWRGGYSEWYPDGTRDITYPEYGYWTTKKVKDGYYK